MDITVQHTTRELIGDFEKDLQNIKAEHASVIASLVEEVDAVGIDQIEEQYRDIVDDVQGLIAAKAANLWKDPSDQEEAIAQVEQWFTNNLWDEGTIGFVASAIWLNGAEQATADIRDALGTLSPSA